MRHPKSAGVRSEFIPKTSKTVAINMTIIDAIYLPIADIKWTYQT